MPARPQPSSGRWRWPRGARAAVSLTYDDGRDNHLDVAIPDLERFRFRGTFYLTSTEEVNSRLDCWRAAFLRGHEIGNHSFNHPSKEELSDYDAGDILAEVGHGALWLKKSIGPDPSRSFAYPHGQVGIGARNQDRASYATAISRYHKVARSAAGAINDPLEVRPPLTIVSANGFDSPEGVRLEDLWSYCEEAVRHGRWAIIMFHDVLPDDYAPCGNQIGRHVHKLFLTYLTCAKLWVAPVKEVAEYIFRARGKNPS